VTVVPRQRRELALQDGKEWEPQGVGGCSSSADSGGVVFREAPGEKAAGCVGLISSGSSTEESGFVDASESGGDVFFLTSQRLLPGQDLDTSLDVYDARVCSAASPCFSEVEGPPPCSTSDSCRAVPSSQPGIFGAPGSGMFLGAGNVASAAAVIPKVLTRKQKLTKALRACRAKHSRRKRKVCERLARRRYGVRFSRGSVSHWGGR
jgi:hypothetical protein